MEPLAEAIRSNPLIKGIDFAKTSHNINVFADNIILMITDVMESLKKVVETQDLFWTPSYYKVSAIKSLTLGLFILSNV